MYLLLFNLATDADDPILGFTTQWIVALSEQVKRIDVITMRVGRIEVPDNVRVYSVGKEKGYSEPRRAVEFYRVLNQLLATERYDACFAHMMPLFAVMAAPLLRLRNIPMVLWYTHKSVTLMLRLATLVVKRVVTASPESFRISSSKVRVIGHGIDITKFIPSKQRNLSDQLFTTITVGRLSPIKKVEILIEAVAWLRKKKPDIAFCLNIVGGPLKEKDKTYEAKLKRLVEQYRLQNIVFFTGSIPFGGVVSFYQKANCFVSMSETGSVDKAVLEAMSCEIPVITNAAFTKVLGENLAKTWVIERDAKQLSDRLLILTSMSAIERQKLGKELRRTVVREHSLDKLCNRLIYELQEVSS
ncbi:glycosyltransferase [Lyngbya aestuarii]|uniref:glycosyltransferase n=1 Tax=Lyngbya aestuarii TaxID=118322 RepID=UPI00403D713B